MKKLMLVLCILLAIPLTAHSQAPKATPPGQPLVSITAQHLHYPNNFVLVDTLHDGTKIYAKYSFNRATVVNNVKDGTITLWFLEEYTGDGQAWVLNQFRSRGIDVSGLKDIRFLYYEITMAYADSSGNVLEPLQYQYIIRPQGEVCDSNQNRIAIVHSFTRFKAIDPSSLSHLIRLAEELQKRYRLR